ncbi:MAG: FG-GAP-like repeat-containing protein [Paludibacter sp.]|nr:FG-GAP-like repeat-containing protein [Paludibacter sp.]
MQINYKYYILSILLSLWTAVGWGQTPQVTYQLSSDETGTIKNYTARESITLKPGFHFQAKTSIPSPSNPNLSIEDEFFFSGKIDPGLLFPPTDKTYAVKAPDGTVSYNSTSGTIVGSIPGSASVTPTGAANYQIPIELPDGINGMQPNISLAYNSQGGAGALGTGWDVAGCSAITLGAKNIYFDGQNSSIKRDGNDALYLDGQRLIYLSGGTPDRSGKIATISDGAVYATETENYSSIVCNNNAFKVTTVDGKILEYGNTQNSNGVNRGGAFLGWKLNKVTDNYGNSISYTYSDDAQYLVRIDYAGQSVLFGYVDNNANPRKYFISGRTITLSKLLSTITVQSGNNPLKTYSFDYTSDKRLQTINITASDGTKLGSTTVNWGADNNSVQFNQIGSVGDSNISVQPEGHTSLSYADIDGDGYPDRIEMWVGAPNQYGYVTVYFYNPLNKTYGNAKTLNFIYHDYDKFHQQFLFADINNDGKAEIIYTNNNYLYAYKYTDVGNSRAGSFSTCFTERLYGDGIFTSNYIFDYYDKKIVKLASADVNHDGYNDIVMAFYNKGGEGRRGYAAFFGSNDGLNPIPVNEWTNSGDAFKQIEIGDFDADGKLDIICIPSGNVSQSTPIDNEYISLNYTSNWNINDISGTKDQVLDLNGDGLSDLIAMCPSNNIWRSSTNTGGVFNTPTLKNEPLDPVLFKGPNVHFIDINGDGLVDAINYENNYNWIDELNPNYDPYDPYSSQYNSVPVYDHTVWSIYKNLGNGQLSTTPITLTTTTEVLDNKLTTISDINGDGIADFIINQGANIYALTMPNDNRRNLVSSITNGLNQSESFTYKNFADYDAYTIDEATAKVRSLRAPLLLVDTYTQADGSTTSYTYASPKYHTEGKGFLGFTTVTSTNTQKNVKVISNYEINTTYYFSVLASQHISTVGGTDNVSVSSLTNSVKVIDATNKRYIPIVTQQSSTDKQTGITQTTTYEYKDSPGKLTQTTTVDNLTTETVSTFTKPTTLANATPYLPLNITVKRTQNGETYTRTTGYSYLFDATNPYKITQKVATVDAGDANSVVTTYSNYDPWGHPQNVTVASNGITRTSTIKCYKDNTSETNAGRFIKSKTNALDETTTYNWNETTGLLDSEKDELRNRVTSYTYDAWGQLTETKYPDGNRKTSVLQWAGTGAPTGAVYYSYSQISGNAPVTTWYDALGREIQSDSYGLKDANGVNKKISISTEYYTENDIAAGKRKGMVYRVSEPYFEADAAAKTWAKTIIYDEFGRPKKATTPMGDVSTNYVDLTTTITTPESTTITTLNNAGQTVSSSVNGKKVTYTYYASGLTKSSTPQDGQAVTMQYDLQGKRIKLTDPNSGLIRSEYNGFGELTKEVQKIHLNKDSIQTINTYKPDGRLESINRNNEITSYTYDTYHRVGTIELKDKNGLTKNRQTFTYDLTNVTDRVVSVKEEIADNNNNLKVFISGKEYDALGRIKKETYPSNYYTINSYDSYSNLTETKDGNGRSIWKAVDENAKGQLLHLAKDGKTTTYDYWDNGLTKEIKADNVVDMYYEYESDTHNLHLREDKLTSQTETMGYDGLNRLISWTVNRNGIDTPYSMSYDNSNGTITQKSDLGAFTLKYGGEKEDGTGTKSETKIGIANGILTGPHALTTISGVPASFPNADLAVTYTDFKKIATLTEGSKTYSIGYGVDDQRRVSVQTVNGVTTTRYYVGNYEEEITGNVIRKIHYLSGAILIQNSANVNDSLLYTYSDAQGSLIALTDANGVIVRKYAYDPWGARRDANDWTQKDNQSHLIINRGYTGHEHLDAFGIINMNGRVYDPATASFFSPDPTLTDAGNWLDYNRYGYCLNNPFKYTDPSGYTWWAENWQPVVTTAAAIVVGGVVGILAAPLGVIATGMLAGAAGGAAAGVVGTAVSGGSFSDCLEAGLKGAIIGGMSGALTAGVGVQFGNVGSIVNELERAAAHALVQGGFSVLRGGNFWQGAAAGLISSFAGSASGALGINDGWMIAVSAFTGGVGAYVAGGHSAEEILFGMVSGAMVGALNFAGGHYDKDKAVDKMNKIALSKSQGQCAKYVRIGLEAGGLNTTGHPLAAKDYNEFLQKRGFVTVDSENYVPAKGDIAVFDSFQGKNTYHAFGHIQMYNGSQWISDFKQSGFWAGSDYRVYKPSYTILRWGNE